MSLSYSCRQARMPPLMLQALMPRVSRYLTARRLVLPRTQETGSSRWSESGPRSQVMCCGVMVTRSSQGMLVELARCAILQMLLGRTSSIMSLGLSARYSPQLISFTSGITAFAHWLYFAQSQLSICRRLAPHPMHPAAFLRRATLLNSHFLPSKVSSLPYREDCPFTTNLMVSMPSSRPTRPGTMPTTPRVEHPPALTWPSPQRQRQQRLSPPKTVIWASQPTQAPLSTFLPLLMQQSLTMQRQPGLSDPSMTRSQWSSACTVQSLTKGCLLTVMCGLMLCSVRLRDSVFSMPIRSVLWPTCLCRLVISTTSESKSPSVPIPAAARYMAKGQPTPPAPIIATLLRSSFSWPSQEIQLRSICREQRYAS